MRSDQKPSARYLPRGDRPTRHAEQRAAEPQGTATPSVGHDVEHDAVRPAAPADLLDVRTGPDAVDLRDQAVVDLRATSSPTQSSSGPAPDTLVLRPGWAPELLPRDGFYVRCLKPSIDRIVAAILLVVLSPLILLIAIGLLVTLRRPILFRQTRVGRNGVPFVLWKFRTMRPDRRKRNIPAPVERRVCHKSPDDPRHTRFGRLLRGTRLDELPQLANVLRGDMSLVGPRPELAEIVARYEPWQHERHLVRPGMTGLWQVSVVNNGMMHEHTAIDLEYIREMDLRTDLRILLRTPAALVFRRGS